MDDDDRRIVSVITEVGAIRRPLDYLIPLGFKGPTEAGSRVRVPLHGRSVKGWIVGPGGSEVPAGGLLEVSKSMGFGPPADVVELCRWAAWRWAGTEARFLSTASPTTNVPTLPKLRSDLDLSAPSTTLAVLGRDLASSAEPTSLRMGPATDPFDLILGFIEEATSRQEGSVVVIVPGLGYAGRLTRRLARRSVPAVEAQEGWDAARAGWPVVVGTRTAAFAPVSRLSGILVVDAEDQRLRSEGAPTWSAVDVAIERARRSGVPVGLVSSCPTPSLAVLDRQVAVDHSLERSGWPKVIVADRQGADPRTGWFSEEFVRVGAEALEEHPEGTAIACIINRTGRAKLLACRRCSELARCATCSTACSLGDDELICPRCAEHRPVICTSCGGTAMKLLRPGTAKLTEDLAALLGISVTEVTASTPPQDFVGARGVVGTEAVLHRVRRAGMVAFLDLDDLLLSPRPGAELATLALIGRAGRLVGQRSDEESGTVVLQTRLPDHPVVVAAVAGDPGSVVLADVELRSMLGLPPFREVALVKGPGAADLADAASELGIEIRPLDDNVLALIAATPDALCDALISAGRPKDRVTVAVGVEIA